MRRIECFAFNIVARCTESASHAIHLNLFGSQNGVRVRWLKLLPDIRHVDFLRKQLFAQGIDLLFNLVFGNLFIFQLDSKFKASHFNLALAFVL